jgi:opacity protein-like surface antigen
MRRLIYCCWTLTLLALSSTTGHAQARAVLIGFGASFPASDYEDVDSAKTGYQVMAGLEAPFLTNITSLRFDGMLGWNARKTDFRESTQLASLNMRLEVWLPLKIASAKPYVLGGVGYLYHKYQAGQSINDSRSQTELIYGGGAGVEIPIGPLATFLEGRYDYGADLTRIYPIIVGVRFKSG